MSITDDSSRDNENARDEKDAEKPLIQKRAKKASPRLESLP